MKEDRGAMAKDDGFVEHGTVTSKKEQGTTKTGSTDFLTRNPEE